MHPDDEPTARPPSIDHRFAALVRALAKDDPRFVRRCSAPARGGLARVDMMIVGGVLATIVLGIVPLAVGVSLQVIPLLAFGALACLVMPIAGPLMVRRAIVRRRPLWS